MTTSARAGAAILTVLLVLALSAPAFAGTALAVAPTVPASATVGDAGVPASLTITNFSNGAEAAGNVVLNSIDLIPSCGEQSGSFSCASPDPGVFALSSAVVGRAGTACAGITFTPAVTNATTGQASFTPSSPVVLGAPGTATDHCTIDFTFDVKHRPTTDAAPAQPGTQTQSKASVVGTSTATNNPGTGFGSSTTTVAAAPPGLTGTATANAPLGGNISDHVSIAVPSGAPSPTGTVTFTAYAPGDTTCVSAPVFTSTVPVASAAATSADYAAPGPGTYRWIASYSGDANYTPDATTCGVSGQSSVVSQGTPTVTGTATATAKVGDPISDHVDVAYAGSGPAVTGTVTFNLFLPGNTTCTGSNFAFTANVPLSGGGASSPQFVPSSPGTYRWVATYNGDANYAPSSTACSDASQASTISQATPTIAASAGGTPTVGSAINDTATLSGGASPTGSITFTLYGPNDASCTGTPAFTATKPLNGGSANSGDFVPTSAGTYHWIASYGGDVNNAPVSTACDAGSQTSTVTPAATTPTPTATATATATPTATATAKPVITPTPTATPPVVRVAALGLSVKVSPKRDRSLPFLFHFRGKLTLPASVSAAKGCLGKVSVQIKNGTKTISTRTVKLLKTCTYSSSARFTIRARLKPHGGKLRVFVKFLGNPAVSAKRAKLAIARYG